MDADRINELARECAEKLDQPQCDMVTSVAEEYEIRSGALALNTEIIAAALRTVARELLKEEFKWAMMRGDEEPQPLEGVFREFQRRFRTEAAKLEEK